MSTCMPDAASDDKLQQPIKDPINGINIFNAIQQPAFILDTKHTILAANKATCSLMGKSEKELIGRKCYELFHKDDRPPSDCPLNRLLLSGKAETADMEVQAFERYFLVNCSPLFGRDGTIERVIHIANDITEERKALEELKRSEEMYRELFEKGSDLLCLHDLEGNIIKTNLAFKNEYGWSEWELLQMNIKDLIQERFRHEFSDYLSRIVENGRDEGVLAMTTKDGRDLIVEYRNVLVYDSNQNPIGVKGTAKDITEKIRMNRERKQLREQIRRVQKMEAIGTLTGGIAHEFNNILAIILGSTELAIDETNPDSTTMANLNQVRAATLRAAHIVQQLLSFSRKSEKKRSPLKITPIVKEAALFIRNSVPASIQIHEEIDCDADMTMGDPSQIQQLSINLLTNAAEAMREKGGKLTLRLTNQILGEERESGFQQLKSGRYVRLDVSDTGQGIDPHLLEKIFDPYFTTKGLGLGRGMGLSVVHGIVRDHEGGIHIDTKQGEGTTFSVLFPTIMEPTELPADSPEIVRGGTETILMVDDEEQLVSLGKTILEGLGYKVETSTDPVKALELFGADPDQYDLVITDMTMPHMTGSHLASEILKIRPQIPIILCTGYHEQIDEEKAKAAGIRAYLEKPLDRKRLAANVRQAIDTN
ncbi:MAG: PAS domain S-box protein [Desulforhabdus sp.]|nr:PAS domain S-box protein [Desulforhabdus sp.]